ncbi:MAG: 23S rRNA (guanosine(2251)-2'-O)-methyltransferase RlmB [Deltaproteobacteria bacterium]|nr:23S rRNA (guanosine(2251)-2'-O)-methyltransferase RlmB [Deltaproteobacteria bacterium]NIS78220.1 23S rRNA (guanosine(2251)-2'-O)-methyltransferase RlmB [Deltaproteobacteria bacterium]
MLSITGFKIVKEFIESSTQTVRDIYLQEGAAGDTGDKIAALAGKKSIPVMFWPHDDMKKIFQGKIKNGIVARLDKFAYSDIDVILDKRPDKSFFVILDRVYDPHNLGAIARSAHCFGAAAVVIQERRAPSITETSIHASAGALAHLPVVQVVNLSRTVDYLKKKGFWVYGTSAGAGGGDVALMDFSGDVVIIFGSEGEGIRKKLLERCDFEVSVPMGRGFDSLNVSVAAGIVLYTVNKKLFPQ